MTGANYLAMSVEEAEDRTQVAADALVVAMGYLVTREAPEVAPIARKALDSAGLVGSPESFVTEVHQLAIDKYTLLKETTNNG